MAELPMFPLGTVLFPGGGLPLHVFELRYRAMVQICLAGDGEFGVVLIERGSEVGGGDVRSSVGTAAHIVEAIETADGRWALLAAGVGRIRVVEWLPDDPYPRAEVEPWDDPAPGAEFVDAVAGSVGLLRRVVALKAEIGDQVVPVPNDLAGDPVLASYQACGLAPVPTIDKQRLLAAESPEARLALLDRLLSEEAEVLE
ncbi:MAG: LON peptidase substrate-binding domain-containing protein, partial [Actinomycetota bacterium]